MGALLWHGLSVDETIVELETSLEHGLASDEAERRLRRYGPNALPPDEPTRLWVLVMDQFKDRLVLILLGSAAVSLGLALLEGNRDWSAFVDPVVILAILILNAVVGVSQENRAEQAIAALSEYSPAESKVIRDGNLIKVKAELIVPGDVIVVRVGDQIPADARLAKVESKLFRVDQALLTGESESVNKSVDPIDNAHAIKQEQHNIIFSGTNVTLGNAVAIVLRTGQETAIGDIHTSITAQIKEPTPLKERLDEFGDLLAKAITIICMLVWLINIRNFNDPSYGGWYHGAVYYLKIAVALAVAAIPEGLAVVITTCLALGTRKMADQNAIVRNLPSVETLGSVNVICSDKTGTITTNQMHVSSLAVFDNDDQLIEYDIEGSTFSPTGDVFRSQLKVVNPSMVNAVIRKVAQVCSICNDSQLSLDANGVPMLVGEPTEGSLRILVEKLGTGNEKEDLAIEHISQELRINAVSRSYIGQFKRLATFEFTHERKSMSVLAQRTGSNEKYNLLMVKGAPESLISRCTSVLFGPNATSSSMTVNHRQELDKLISEYGRKGYRILVFATKICNPGEREYQNAQQSSDYEALERDLTFLGIVGMLDPPRPEVIESVRKCREAGIRVIMLTGDSKATAETIGAQIGLIDGINSSRVSFTGSEFDQMSLEVKKAALKTARIFSRVEPSHKLALINALQDSGQTVAMTGDGVNDAPALKKADIGIAMGSGTDVARLAADMILADDNFATIEMAIEEGRAIYINMQQFIRYLISSNIGEVVSIFLTVLLGLPEALIPIQLLFVNLVTDGLPATACSFNAKDPALMKHKPRARNERIVGSWSMVRYLIIGAYVGCATVFGYVWWFLYYSQGPQITYSQLSHFTQCTSAFPDIGCSMFRGPEAVRASTMSLSILVIVEMMNALNALSQSESLVVHTPMNNPVMIWAIALSVVIHLCVLYIPFLQPIVAAAPLGWTEWKAVILISLPVILIDELLKWIERTVIDPPETTITTHRIKTE